MLKIRPVMLAGLNIVFLLLSWTAYSLPRGDEYLFVFMIPVVYVLMPFVFSFRQALLLTVLNFIFLTVYRLLGSFNTIDVVVLTALFAFVGGVSYLGQHLYAMFSRQYRREVSATQRKYNSLVAELEVIDKRGKKIEKELSRISRLYEVTKKLAPALTFDDLGGALFDFLEENFTLDSAHLIICSQGKCLRRASRYTHCVGTTPDGEPGIDSEEVIKNCGGYEMNPFFITRLEYPEKFEDMKITADTFMAFPIRSGGEISAVLAVEGAQRTMYGRFRLLTPQIELEFRKVQLYEKVQELSIMDGLTEVYLRRHLMERLKEEVDRAERLGLTFSVGMVDVDHFKDCNDRYGHLIGDAVLNKIADRLKSSVREVDMIARYGGEEFCVVLPETTRDLAVSVGERIRRSVEENTIKAFDEELNMTVSVGVATYPEDGKSIEDLLEKADTALYKAKRRGRNRVCTV